MACGGSSYPKPHSPLCALALVTHVKPSGGGGGAINAAAIAAFQSILAFMAKCIEGYPAVTDGFGILREGITKLSFKQRNPNIARRFYAKEQQPRANASIDV